MAEKNNGLLPPSVLADYLRESANIIREQLATGTLRRSPREMREGFQAVLDLALADFNDMPLELATWRRGYEQCMIDIMEAIADEFGVSLPKAPTPE